MNYTEASPSAALARVVECYWFLSGDGVAREPRRIVPDGRTEIILNFARPFAQLRSNGWRTQRQHFFAGQLIGPLLLRPTGPFDIIGIRLKPAAARSLIDGRLSKMTDRMVPIRSELANLSRTTLDDVLSTQIIRLPDPGVEAAVEYLISTAGSTTSGDLAKIAGWSTRHLQRRFLEDVGLSPRVFARIQRFQKVFRAIEENRNWAQTALECGYFDQGHLIRDFHDFAGSSPSALTGLAEVFLQHRMSHFSRTPNLHPH